MKLKNINRKTYLNSLNDSSLLLLLFTNFITIIIALIQKWDVFEIMQVYVGQSLIIGFMTLIKIFTVKENHLKTLDEDKIFWLPKNKSKISTAYSFFVVYCIPILLLASVPFGEYIDEIKPTSALLKIIPLWVGFFITHLYSLIKNWPKEKEEKKIKDICNFPFYRIILLFLTITVLALFWGNNLIALTFLLIIRSFIDAAIHVIEHKSPLAYY